MGYPLYTFRCSTTEQFTTFFLPVIVNCNIVVQHLLGSRVSWIFHSENIAYKYIHCMLLRLLVLHIHMFKQTLYQSQFKIESWDRRKEILVQSLYITIIPVQQLVIQHKFLASIWKVQSFLLHRNIFHFLKVVLLPNILIIPESI